MSEMLIDTNNKIYAYYLSKKDYDKLIKQTRQEKAKEIFRDVLKRQIKYTNTAGWGGKKTYNLNVVRVDYIKKLKKKHLG